MPKIIKPNRDTLKESDKCNVNGEKIMPFVIRSFKEQVCDIQSGVLNKKKLQSSIFVIFNDMLNITKPHILFPTNFDEAILKCKEQYIIVSVVLSFGKTLSHSNIFIIDKIKKEIEHFEPHGEFFYYNPDSKKTKKEQVFIQKLSQDIKFVIKSIIIITWVCIHNWSKKVNFCRPSSPLLFFVSCV